MGNYKFSSQILIYSLLLSTKISFGDEDLLLKCNWAQSYTDFPELLTNEALQEQIMLTASEWEGKYAASNVGVHLATAITDSITDMDPETGFAGKPEPCFGLFADEESLHLALLAQALNGSKYARRFVESSMQGAWSGSVDDFVIEQLRRKIAVYEEYRSNVPVFGGLMVEAMQRIDTQIRPHTGTYRIRSRDHGFYGWGFIAAGHALQMAAGKNATTVDLAQRYLSYARTLANRLMTIFYDQNTSQLYQYAGFDNNISIFAEFNKSNFHPDCSGVPGGCYIRNYDEDLVVQFVYLLADWSDFGGEIGRAKFIESRRQFLQLTTYQTNSGVITVQRGVYYAAWEKIAYLFLPYFDVAITEQLFLNGERARTHFSALNDYPGLFSSVYVYKGDGCSQVYDSSPGIQGLATDCCVHNDIFTPYAAFTLLLHKKTRAYGLAWYLAMLQGARMQGPLGASEIYQLGENKNLIPTDLSWHGKVTPIIAIGGGVGPIVRSFLEGNRLFEEFKRITTREYEAVFPSLSGDNLPFFMPTTMINSSGTRFSGCSNMSYAVAAAKDSKTVVLKETVWIAIGGVIAAVCVAVITICLMYSRRRRRIKRIQTLNRDLPPINQQNVLDKKLKVDLWELAPGSLSILYDRKLGSGAFACVYEGILKELPLNAVRQRMYQLAEERSTQVAVKMPLETANVTRKGEFLEEIKFMKGLGFHVHLLNMLGCISNPNAPILVVDYCEHGDLHRVLCYNKQLMQTKGEITVETSERTLQLELNDLTRIAWQICDAMVFLSSCNCVHRDLAARNILLTGHILAKIADFGLCRRTQQADYTSCGGLLPFKWMAPESLRDMKFSTKSDVWSFGVLLYEIFSLGSAPYAMLQNLEIIDYLESGNRLPQPQFADEDIYDLMRSCWLDRAVQRPSFDELRSRLVNIIETKAYEYTRATEVANDR